MNKPADWVRGEDYNARVEQPSWPANKIKIGERHRKELGDIGALAADINQRGLLHPIVIDLKNNLIAGERRLAAWKISKFRDQAIPVHTVPLEESSPANGLRMIRRCARISRRPRRSRSPASCGRASRPRPRNASAPAAATRIRRKSSRPRKAAPSTRSPGRPASRAHAREGGSDRRRGQEGAGEIRQAQIRHGQKRSCRRPVQAAANHEGRRAIRKEPPPMPGNGPYRGIVGPSVGGRARR